MHARLLVLGCLVAALAVPAQAQTTTAVFDAISQRVIQQQQKQVDPAATADIRFRDDGHQRMTVAVTLDSAGPFRFLVDTGADRTAISRELVESLKLSPGRQAQLHSVAGISDVATANIPELRFSSQLVSSIEAPVLERSDMGADGILALDSLRSQRVMFDFRKNSMSVLPSPRRVYRDEPGTIVVRARERNGRLVLSRARADGVDVTVIIDTGSEVTVGNAALRENLARKMPHSGQVELQSVTGQMLPGEYTFLRRLEFGGIELGQLAVVFANAHTFKQLGLENKPAILLGMNAMRAFDSVSIDFAQKTLRIVVPERTILATRAFGAPIR